MQIKNKREPNKILGAIKSIPILSYWRPVLFIILTIGLFIILLFKFNFSAFVESIMKLDFWAFFWLIVLSLFEQFLIWERYRRFMVKSHIKQFFDYISVSTVATVVPPKPLGLYYRFLLSMHLFKTNIKNTAFLVAIDTFYEGFAITLFAVISLFIFPKANLGLEIILYVLGAISLVYIIFTYYEARRYLVKNSLFKKLLTYFSKLKTQILDSFYNLLKQNKWNIFIGFVLSIARMIVCVFKVYLLFRFFGLDVGFWICLGIWSIANLVGNGSSLPGGLGAFELSFVYLAKTVNIPESIALYVAIMERFFEVWMWAIFTAIYLFYKKTKVWIIHDLFLQNISKFADRILSEKAKSNVRKVYRKVSKEIEKVNAPAKKILKKVSNKIDKL
jgi:uncharacterized protein (TIRG00374 family)